MKKFVLLVILALVAAPVLAADVYIKTKAHTDAMAAMGQNVPAQDSTTEAWISGNRMANVTADMTLVVDADKGVALFINHKDKSYVSTPLPLDFAKLLPPEAASMLSMLQMSATVAPSTETKKIGEWDCTGYNVVLSVMGMQLNLRVWATTKVPFDLDAFASKLQPAVFQSQLRLDAKSAAEFAKIKGYQIATETSGDMMGAKLRSTTEVVEISTKAAPAGIFDAPAGYAKKATLGLADLQRR